MDILSIDHGQCDRTRIHMHLSHHIRVEGAALGVSRGILNCRPKGYTQERQEEAARSPVHEGHQLEHSFISSKHRSLCHFFSGIPRLTVC
jgi:hypothetical protein